MMDTFTALAVAARTPVMAARCCSLVAWSTTLLVLWLVEPVIHTLEKCFCNPSLLTSTRLTPQHMAVHLPISADVLSGHSPNVRTVPPDKKFKHRTRTAAVSVSEAHHERTPTAPRPQPSERLVFALEVRPPLIEGSDRYLPSGPGLLSACSGTASHSSRSLSVGHDGC